MEESGIDAWMKMEAMEEMERIKTDAMKERARYEQRMKRRQDLREAGKVVGYVAGSLVTMAAFGGLIIGGGTCANRLNPRGIEAVCRAAEKEGTPLRDVDGKVYLLKCEEHKPILYEIGAEGRGQ